MERIASWGLGVAAFCIYFILFFLCLEIFTVDEDVWVGSCLVILGHGAGCDVVFSSVRTIEAWTQRTQQQSTSKERKKENLRRNGLGAIYLIDGS